MIDIKLLRAQPDDFRHAAEVKGYNKEFIDELLAVDADLLRARQELQDVKTQQNQAGKQIAKLKGDEKQAAVAKMGELKSRARSAHETSQRSLVATALVANRDVVLCFSLRLAPSLFAWPKRRVFHSTHQR